MSVPVSSCGRILHCYYSDTLSVVYAYKLKPTITLCKSSYKCSVKQIMAYVIDPRIPLNLSNLKHQIKFLDGFEGPYTANTSSPLLMCEG